MKDSSDYLDRFDREEEPEKSAVPPRTRTGEPFHPWRRFFARMLDYALVEVLLQALLVCVIRVRPYGKFLDFLVEYGALFLAIPISAMFLSCFGATPGKWLLGLQVQADSGEKLSFSDAMHREWMALVYGYGLGIPVLSLYRLYRSYKNYHDHGTTEWEYLQYVECKSCKFGRKLLYILAAIAIFVAQFVIEVDLMLPKYRGEDLTVAQFAENFNDFSEAEGSDSRMLTDGTWEAPGKNSVIIHIDGTPDDPDAPLIFTTEGEAITKIVYKNRWTQLTRLHPFAGRLQRAIMTAVFSQGNVGVSNIFQYTAVINSIGDEAQGSVVCGDVEIRWNIDYQNCQLTTGGYFVALPGNGTEFVSLTLEIIYHG